ncbi:hypothetical protein PIB30_087259, partial [Stylosanthes scabra]|nr:hypothetical protein [Stylosanthes scabra]
REKGGRETTAPAKGKATVAVARKSREKENRNGERDRSRERENRSESSKKEEAPSSPSSKPFRCWGCCAEVRRCDGGGCSSPLLCFPLPSPLKCKCHTCSSYHRGERIHRERVSSKREGNGTSIGAPPLRASPPRFRPPGTAPLLLKSTATTVTEFPVTAVVACGHPNRCS